MWICVRGGCTCDAQLPRSKAESLSGHRRLGLGAEWCRCRKSWWQVFARRLAGRESDPQAPAVLSPRGGMLRANNWRRHTKWNTAIKQAGVAPLTIHDLRHTYASLARAAGADLRFVQRTLGHSSPVVTANIYSDLYDSELDTVATNLDRMHENSAFPTGQEPDTNKNP